MYDLWANLPNIKVNTNTVEVLVRDCIYEFSPSKINQIFDIPQVDERTHRMKMARILKGELADFMSGGKVRKWKGIHFANLTKGNKLLYKICCNNWLPTSNDAYAQPARAKLIYMMAPKIHFNFNE